MKLKHFDHCEVWRCFDDLFILVIVDKSGKIATLERFTTENDVKAAADLLYDFLAKDSPVDLLAADLKAEIQTVGSAIFSGDVTDGDLKNLSAADIFKKAKRRFH